MLEDAPVEAEVGKRFSALGFRETGGEGFLKRRIAFYAFVQIRLVLEENSLSDRLRP